MKGASLFFKALFALLVLCLLFPLALLCVASLTPEGELQELFALDVSRLSLAHFRAIMAERQFYLPLRNSLVVATATTILSLLLGATGAYAIARMAEKKRALALGILLAVSMFPPLSIIPPLYLLLRYVGLINTYAGLVLPYVSFSLPLAIWLLVSYFRELPPDLEEAAAMDGANRFQILWQIVLPLAVPGVVSAGVLVFIYCWNEFLFALSFTTGPDRQTVPVALALLKGRYQMPWGQIFAASVIAGLPVIALVIVFQRRIVYGLTAGAVKG